MKSIQITSIVASIFATTAFAQFPNLPSCGLNCFQQVVSGTNFNGDYKSLCNNATALNTLQTCLAGSSCSSGDKGTIQAYINSVCGSTVTISGASVTTTFSNWPSGSGYPGGFPGGFPFGSGPGGWGAHSGAPFGGSWGPWGSSGPWTTGAWTSWWDGSACPGNSWTGWTSGAWSTDAPWTSWTACTATATTSSVVTSTINGTPTTYTSEGFQVQQATATKTASGFATGAASGGRDGVMEGAIGAGIVAFVGAVLML